MGRGEMGAVYKARQVTLDRLVAIKVLPQPFSQDAAFVTRFQREARFAAAQRRTLYPEDVPLQPFGIYSWTTRAALRTIPLRRLKP